MASDPPRLIVQKRYFDDRGWFSETFHARRLRDAGITCAFVQENLSRSERVGTLRGLHFQLPPSGQAKLVSVLRGKILDVIVDIRRGSPTYGRHSLIELSDDTGQQLYVPLGFAHGFVTLVDDVWVSYKVSNYYEPTREGGVRWNDSDIQIPWPIEEPKLNISEKDRRLPYFKEFRSPFAYEGDPLSALPVVELV